MKRLLASTLALVLLVTFSALTFAQDKMQKEAKKDHKMEMTKGEKEMGPMKSASCGPDCGFMVRSHDEKEVMSIIKAHAKTVHKMEMSDKQVKDMMKNEGEMKKGEGMKKEGGN